MKKLLFLSFIMVFGFLLIGCDTNTAAALDNQSNQTSNVFTLADLAQYTGANGSTAYIAVNGTIYDVTKAFTNGKHQGMQLGGTDATQVFASSPHSAALLATLPVVGTLGTTSTLTSTSMSTDSNTTITTTNTSTTTTTSSTLPVFTLTELSQYTGANGSTAYIAVNGVVYDVTNAFSNGTHQGMQLSGTDATAVFASSPHSASLLTTLTVVGSLEGFDPIVVEITTTTENPPVVDTAVTETLPVFTLTELSQYTGANGSTAYIAVNGVVYDVTRVFSNGTHQGMQLGGTDATAVFASSPHSASLLATLTVVGSLEGYELIVVGSTSTTTTTTNQSNYDDDDNDDDSIYGDDDDDDDDDDDHYSNHNDHDDDDSEDDYEGEYED